MNSFTISTERLLLIPCTATHIEAFLESRDALAALLGCSVPKSWPVFPEGLPWWLEELRADPSMVGWANWIFVLKDQGNGGAIVIGDGGFKGKPNDAGDVEIGYAIIPEFRERGFATEATGAMIEWAFSHPEVRSVSAHTLADGYESMNVLKKHGMVYISNHHDPEDGDVILWQRSKEIMNWE